MKKVDVGIVSVNFLDDILRFIKNENYQLLRENGYEDEFKKGYVEFWINDLLDNFCKPLIKHDKDTEIILED